MSLLLRAAEAERRQRRAVKQIGTEFLLRDHLRQIGVGGADQAHVNLQRLAAADALQFTILNHAQQLFLHQHRRGGEFIKEQGAAVGALKTSRMALLSAGKTPACVAEQLGIEQVFIQRRTV